MIEKSQNPVDLSFLKPITTKKKVVDLFKSSVNASRSVNGEELNTEEHKEQALEN